MKPFHKYTILAIGLLFAGLAIFRFTLDHPWYMSSVFLGVSVLYGFAFKEKIDKTILLLGFVVFLCSAIFLLPDTSSAAYSQGGYSTQWKDLQDPVGLGLAFLAVIYLWYVKGTFW